MSADQKKAEAPSLSEPTAGQWSAGQTGMAGQIGIYGGGVGLQRKLATVGEPAMQVSGEVLANALAMSATKDRGDALDAWIALNAAGVLGPLAAHPGVREAIVLSERAQKKAKGLE